MSTVTTTESVVAEYRAADVSTKASMRAAVKASILAAVASGDIEAAQAAVATQDAMLTPAAKAAPKTDFQAAYVTRVETLRVALSALECGDFNIEDMEDVDSDLFDSLTTLKSRKATRGDVGAFIASAVAASAGFLKVSVIRKHRDEFYGDDAPSAGAIASALTAVESGTRTIEGVVAKRDSEGRLGAESA